MGGIRRPGRAAFLNAGVELSASTLPEHAVADTVIGTLQITGYSGPVTVELVDTFGGKLALSQNVLTAGATEVEFSTDTTLAPVFKLTATIGGAVRLVPLVVTIVEEADITPFDFAVRPTKQTLVDINDILAPVASDDWITLSVTGSVSALVWPETTVASGQIKLFRKRELTKMLAAVTTGAAISPTAGTWDLTWTGSSGEVRFAVEALPAAELIWDFGIQTSARAGGFTLANISGNGFEIVSQPTIAGQAQPFEIFPPPLSNSNGNNGRLVPRSTNGTATSYGSIKAVTTWPTGALGDVVVRDLQTLTEYTIPVNGIPYQRDVAPTPAVINGGVDTSSNSQLTGAIYTNHNYGDVVMLEDGVYNPTNADNVTTTPPSGSRTQRPGGPAKPTDETGDGWIVVKSRSYLGATVKKFTMSGRDLTATGDGFFVCWENIQNGVRDSVQGIRATTSSGSNKHRWIQFRYCQIHTALAFNATNAQSHNIFVFDCHFTGATGTQLFLAASLSRVVGCLFEYGGEDCIKHGIWEPLDTDYSLVAFNYAKHKHQTDAEPAGDVDHADFCQMDMNSNPNTPAIHTAVNAPGCPIDGTVVDGPRYICNAWTRGTPRLSQAGNVGKDGQGYFLNDKGYTKVRERIAGMICQTTFGNGILIRGVQNGSFARNVTMLFAYGASITGGQVADVPRIGVNDPGATLELKDCVLQGTVFTDSGATMPSKSGVLESVSEATFATYFDDPYAGVGGNPTLAELLEAFTPIHSDLLSPVTGRVIGAVTPLADWRLRTWDESLMAPP